MHKFKVGDRVRRKKGTFDIFTGTVVHLDWIYDVMSIKRDDGLGGAGFQGTWATTSIEDYELIGIKVKKEIKQYGIVNFCKQYDKIGE